MKYTKPALTVDQQITQLQNRGMVFGDRSLAARYLREINYYRLRGYWLRCETDRIAHRFAPGTTFESVLADYVFDRELRLLVLDAVERLEVSLRTRLAHHVGLRYGPHGHLDSTIFKDRSQQWSHPRAVASLVTEVERSTETFIRHIRRSYDELLPPIWVAVEVMTFGQVSLWFRNLRHAADRQAVGSDYGLDEALLSSFLHHLAAAKKEPEGSGRITQPERPGPPLQFADDSRLARRQDQSSCQLGFAGRAAHRGSCTSEGSDGLSGPLPDVPFVATSIVSGKEPRWLTVVRQINADHNHSIGTGVCASTACNQ